MKRWLERAAISLIVLGLLNLCQPFTITLFRIGFPILLTGTVLFIVAVHLPEPSKRR